MTTSMSDNTLARVKELLEHAIAKKHGDMWNDALCGPLDLALRNNVEALISRLEAAEARAAAAEAACIDARRALGLALLADGLCDEIKARLKIAWLRVGGSNARAALTANPKDTGGEQ